MINKKDSRLYTIIFISLILFLNLIYVQASHLPEKYKEISITDGLSNNTIRSIVQDKKGFLWFGSENGLNKYNGYSYKHYHHKVEHDNSISDSFIRVIFMDSQGNLWIGTDNGGLVKYNWKSEQFNAYRYNPDSDKSISGNTINAIYESQDGFIWIGTANNGLNRYNINTNIFTRYKHDKSNINSLSNNFVQAIIEDNEGNIWIGTKGGGLNCLNRTTNTFSVYYSYPEQPNSLSSVDVNDIVIDNNFILWIATDDGLNSFDPKTNLFSRYYSDPTKSTSISNNRINTLFIDKNNNLWIGTDIGVDVYNIQSDCFRSIRLQSPKVILTIFEDLSGIFWCGTLNNGIIKLTSNTKIFQSNLYNEIDLTNEINTAIRSIYIDNKNNLWLGTDGDGLKYIDHETCMVYHFPSQSTTNSHINGNVISEIFEDRNGYFWIGSWGDGITRFQLTTADNGLIKNAKYYKKNRNYPNSLADNIIQCIFEDSKDNMWIGTDDGLDLFNPQSENFTHFRNQSGEPKSLIDNRIQSNAILEDDEGNVWIGTWSGISKMNYAPSMKVEEICFTNYSSVTHGLSDNRVTGLLYNNDIIWVATAGGGLNKLNIKQGQYAFISYQEEEGLPNNLVYSLIDDHNGNLWLSTNHGLAKFNPKTDSFKNYFQSDGLLSNQFYWGAVCKDNSGNIYLGNLKGLNAFNPDEITNNEFVPPIVISDIQLSNRSIYSISVYQHLLERLNENRILELPFHNYSYTFEFVALDYYNPEKNRYAYCMEGVDKDWIDAGNRRFVTYSNLKEGHYTFKVKGSNDDGLWNTKGTSVDIIIHPPFWRTWWFISLIVLTFFGNIGYIAFLKFHRYMEIENLRQQIASDLHDNVGADLTEISIVSEVLSRKEGIQRNMEIQKGLQIIGTRSRELVDSMSDIIWLINPKKDTLYEMIMRLGDCYSDVLFQSGISFQIKKIDSLKKIIIKPDVRQHLFLIFKEALNNCIKHSQCKSIILRANVDNRHLTVYLYDDGKGFDPLVKSSGNGLINMVERSRKIKGELEIISKSANGTKIIFHGLI